VPPRVIRVIEVGDKARRLIDGASVAHVVAALSRSLYLDVGGEIVWLGPPGSTLHTRAIVVDDPPIFDAGARIETSFDLREARPWRPHPLDSPIDATTLVRASRRLVEGVDRLGRPDGFGALLVGRRPAFPLDHAAERARGFLESCARDAAAAAATIGERLLGLGPGLTPAGDDLVGGAFFARRFSGWGVPAAPPIPPRRAVSDDCAFGDDWTNAAGAIRAGARERTHPISATLLGDLLDGCGHAPLHDLALALARDDGAAALDAAGRLVRIGHSSGWDMLTGVLGALCELPAMTDGGKRESMA
jgi:hypothetical protein